MLQEKAVEYRNRAEAILNNYRYQEHIAPPLWMLGLGFLGIGVIVLFGESNPDPGMYWFNRGITLAGVLWIIRLKLMIVWEIKHIRRTLLEVAAELDAAAAEMKEDASPKSIALNTEEIVSTE